MSNFSSPKFDTNIQIIFISAVRHEGVTGSRQLHQIRLMFNDDGTPVRNQIQVRRYSCICDGCRKGEDCTVEWSVNRWESKRLVLKTRQNEQEIPLINLPNDDLIFL